MVLMAERLASSTKEARARLGPLHGFAAGSLPGLSAELANSP